MLLARSWRWRTTLDSEMPSSPDTLRVLLAGFAMAVKMTNHIEQWDTELTWYSPSATRWTCQGRESDEPHWTIRYRARLMLSECYSPDLPRPWKWRTTLNCEMPSSPDTLRVLLAGLAKAVKVTNHIEQWDIELAWYSPSATCRICQGRESDEPHWTVRCRARLILSKCYSPDLPRPCRWRTQLDCEIKSLVGLASMA